MACIRPDGSLTETAKAMLRTLTASNTLTSELISARLNFPMYIIRSGLRELSEAGFIQEQEGNYFLTQKGKEKL